MGAPWRTLLEGLNFSDEAKGNIIFKLYASNWGQEGIQTFFDDCLSSGGTVALKSALANFLDTEGSQVGKKVKIFSVQADGEDLVLKGRWVVLTPHMYQTLILPKGLLVILNGAEDAQAISEFGDVIEGESYLLEEVGSTYGKIKALENFNHTEMRACEAEFAESMMTELKAHGIATHPVVRMDLRLRCAGSKDEQELDVVLLDEGNKAFIGSAKHVARGPGVVQQVLGQAHTVLQRSKDLDKYHSYAPFRGRSLGCCVRVDYIDNAKRHEVERLCYRKGVGLFRRSGAGLALRRLPFTEQQVVDVGFINMLIRGLTKLAR